MGDAEVRTASTRRLRNRRRVAVSPAADDDVTTVPTSLSESQSALFFLTSTASEDGDDAASSETLVADRRDSDAEPTTPDDVRSTSAPPPPCADDSTAAEQDSSELERQRRPQLSRSDHKNCSAREAIVRTSHISALLASKNFHWSDTQLANQQTPDADQQQTRGSPSPKVSPARNDRFARKFPEVSDTVINSYHCAYVGDVLFQGILYVTQNWFCFHSKLLGKKSIKIAVSSVTDVVKMNTVMIIPNAVGIYTASHKYVFGSLLSRRNTYHLLLDVWKQSQDQSKLEQRNDVELDISNNNRDKKGASTLSERTSSSKSIEELRSSDEFNSDVVDDDDDASTAAAGRPLSPSKSAASPAATAATAVRGDGGTQPASTALDGPTPPRTEETIDDALTAASSATSPWKLRGRWTFLCLILLTAVVIVLTFAAVFLAYKLIHLQALIDAYANVMAVDVKFADTIHRDAEIYRLRHEEHSALVERLRSSVEAHIHLLNKVNESLKTLCKFSVESQTKWSHAVDDQTQTQSASEPH